MQCYTHTHVQRAVQRFPGGHTTLGRVFSFVSGALAFAHAYVLWPLDRLLGGWLWPGLLGVHNFGRLRE